MNEQQDSRAITEWIFLSDSYAMEFTSRQHLVKTTFDVLLECFTQVSESFTNSDADNEASGRRRDEREREWQRWWVKALFSLSIRWTIALIRDQETLRSSEKWQSFNLSSVVNNKRNNGVKTRADTDATLAEDVTTVSLILAMSVLILYHWTDGVFLTFQGFKVQAMVTILLRELSHHYAYAFIISGNSSSYWKLPSHCCGAQLL